MGGVEEGGEDDGGVLGASPPDGREMGAAGGESGAVGSAKVGRLMGELIAIPSLRRVTILFPELGFS